MRVTFLAALTVALFSPNPVIGQSTKELTITKGAVTIGTLTALQDIRTLQEMASGGDKGNFLPFLTFNSDNPHGGQFFR